VDGVVIPARWASSRLPGKALAEIGGVPMVERVRRCAARARADRVWVATDDERVVSVIRSFGGHAVLTPPCASGTARVAWACRDAGFARVVNVQGDQPFVDPAHINLVFDALRQGHTLVTLSAPLADPADPACVKVVVDRSENAMYFSRAPIPWGGPWRQHVGIYGFSAVALRMVAELPAPLTGEDLEQLAWLESGLKIHVVAVDAPTFAIDTPAQLAAARARLAEGSDA
jgi:3-deoxy-manno-octulosonate cytidylyltransferase (CMP-KDO synthetase)